MHTALSRKSQKSIVVDAIEINYRPSETQVLWQTEQKISSLIFEQI